MTTQFLNDLNIGTKLTIGFGTLVMLMSLSIGMNYLGSKRATIEISRVDDVRVPVALAAFDAQANLLRMLGDVRGYLALGDPTYRESHRQSVQAFEINLTGLDELSSNLDAESRDRLHELRAVYADWAKLPDQLFELRDDRLKREPAYRLLLTKGTQHAGRVLIDHQHAD